MKKTAIAIIGLSCRFPKAGNYLEYWENLAGAKECISFFTDPELRASGVDESLLSHPGYVKAGGFLEDTDLFDASFFGVSPRDAQIMSPQHRLSLECAVDALAASGYRTSDYEGSIGVYMGAGINTYLLHNLWHHQQELAAITSRYQAMVYNLNDTIPSLISYKLNLRGPAVNINTTCSTSAVTVHYACQALLTYECDMALAGGVSLQSAEKSGYVYQEGGILSPDGHCRAFDAQAAGTVGGSGIGMVVLKRLDEAISDRDHIYAVIEGSAINNDGAGKVGYTAPGIEGQTAVILDAHTIADIEADSISYIETHGTGTAIGDPIEITALRNAFGNTANRKAYCAIGSVKTNVGHLDAAAGVASLIKTTLALKYKKIPASLHYQTPNPAINFEDSPFYVNAALKDWETNGTLRRAGVSSFGIGGTNAHLILSEAPETTFEASPRTYQLITLSARTRKALKKMCRNLAGYLQTHQEPELADIAYTLQLGREEFEHKAIVVSDHMEGLIHQLKSSDILSSGKQKSKTAGVAFVCPGRSVCQPGTIQLLYETEAVFKKHINRCVRYIREHSDTDIKKIILAKGEADKEADTPSSQHPAEDLAVFSVELALAKLWMSWGVRPRLVAGHGTGIYTAACLAGVCSIEDAIALISRPDEPSEPQSGKITLSAPKIPLFSMSAGAWVQGQEAVQLLFRDKKTTHSAHGLENMSSFIGKTDQVLLEVGFGDLDAYPGLGDDTLVLRSLPGRKDKDTSLASLYLSLGMLWLNGVRIDWPGFYAYEKRNRVPLPGYPFERVRHWIAGKSEPATASKPLSGQKTDHEKTPEDKPVGSSHDRPGLSVPYVLPQNETEHKLTAIWEQLFGIKGIGVNDDFFELGGDSLSAVQLSNLISEQLDYKLSVADIFSYPTPSLISGLLNDSRSANYSPVKRQQTRDYPLSNAQRRLWVLSKFEGGSRAYHMPVRLTLKGELQTVHFHSAVSGLVSRHEVLRTGIVERDGQVFQHVYKREAVKVPVKIITVDKKEKAEAMVTSFFNKDFNLSKPPLFRIYLLKQKTDHWELLFNMHHIISDGWSMPIFLNELSQLYNSYISGEEPLLDPLKIHYGDYSYWMEQNLNDRDWDNKHGGYWRSKFKELPSPLELSADHPRPRIKDYRGGVVSHRFSKKEQAYMETLCSRYRLTSNMSMLMVLSVLLYRYSGQQDIVIGTPVSGRGHSDLSGQLGFYVNTLPLRIALSAEDTTGSLSEKISRIVLEALEHQMYPYDRLVEELPLDRDTSRNPLYDVILVYQNNPPLRIAMQDIELEVAGLSHSASKFDLGFNFSETEQGLEISTEYWSGIFTRERIEQMLLHFRTLLQAMALSGDRSISSLEMVAEKEKKQLLSFIEGPKTVYPKDKTIMDLFREQAVKTPRATAVVFKDKKLTYRELDQRSEQLAGLLVSQTKAGKDQSIALLLSGSDRMVVAILGVLKSGSAYVPVDPDYPKARKAYMIRDNAPVCVISEDSLYPDAAVPGFIPVLLISENSEEIALKTKAKYEKFTLKDIPVTNSLYPLKDIMHPDGLAYVIYTSGSTGKPKGVMISNKAMSNHILWFAENLQLSDKDSTLLTHSYTVDTSIAYMWGSLLSGGIFHIMPSGLMKDPEALLPYIAMAKISYLKFTPTLFSLLVNSKSFATQDYCSSVRYVMLGGEAPRLEDIERYLDQYGDVTFSNHYGPTEGTIDVSTYDFKAAQVSQLKKQLIIGRPLYNTEVYILSAGNALQPVLVFGELCVSGMGLAKGYLNNPELTDEKFIAHPFKKGARLYKTGDLARWLPDGNIEFLGRKDQQLKVRGYRIEPGEISYRLNKHPGVKDAVVAGKEINGNIELVAYLIPEKETTDKAALRAYLQESLPSYMIPSYWMDLDVFPQTASGKTDRKALPDPEGGSGGEAGGYASDTATLQLETVWKDILGLAADTRIGVGEDFFALGGHSLRAVRLSNSIAEQLGYKLSITDIFSHPTLALMSGLLNDSRKSDYMPIRRQQRSDYPLSNAQSRLWIMSKFDGGNKAYHMPAHLILTGALQITHFYSAVTHVTTRHEVLRTGILEKDGQAFQRVYDPEAIDRPVSVTDVRDKPRETIAQLIRDFYSRDFDLSRPPLFKIALLQCETDQWELLFNMHHIVSDGWSVPLFLNELTQCYNAYVSGGEPLLPELSMHYGDYSLWMEQNLNTPHWEQKHGGYWREKFKTLPQPLQLPADYSRPRVRDYSGDRLRYVFNREEGKAIDRLCEQFSLSPSMSMLMVLSVLLYRYSGQEDIVIGTVVSGRSHADLAQQLGFYVNIIPVRITMSDRDTAASLSEKVRVAMLEALEHQMYPYDRLVDELPIKRDTSRNPLYDVTLTYQNNEESSIAMQDVAVELASPTNTISKFDLSFIFGQTDQGPEVNIDYCNRIFKQERITGMLSHFRIILQAMAAE